MSTLSPTKIGSTTSRRTVIGVFDGPNRAEMALSGLQDAGFSPRQISVVARDAGAGSALTGSTEMGGGATATGAVLGGLTGGALGWLVGIGALAIPGVGPVVAAGALATAIGGAALGAAAGGLIGALVDLGVPETEARVYATRVREGSILLTISANDAAQVEQARQIFERHGGAEVRAYGAIV